jgi:hypothetical protein
MNTTTFAAFELAPRPLIHKHRYVNRREEFMKSGFPIDFDCMVEVAFADEDAFLAYMGKLFGPEAVDDAVAVDEARFLDRSSDARIRRRRACDCWMRACDSGRCHMNREGWRA